MRITILLSICLLFSCSDKLTRAKKLIAKAESEGAVWSRDTVVETIEIIRPTIQADTVFKTAPGDTVTLTKENLQIRYIHLPGNEVILEGECKGDTVIVEKEVIVTNTIESKSGFAWWYLLIAGLVGAGLIAVFKR